MHATRDEAPVHVVKLPASLREAPMRRGSRTLTRRASALAVVFSLALAVPSRAADDAPRPEPQKQRPSLALAATAHAERAELQRAVETPSDAAAAETSAKPFFKTRRGIVTGVLMAAALGWVIYSKSNEGVTSPAND
jgi:hypothetical protein